MGKADAVAEQASDHHSFADLWSLLRHGDPLVRMRAADAADKASRLSAHLLIPHRGDLLSGELDGGSSDLTWHLLPMAARLPLSEDEAARLMRRCEYVTLNHPSHTVQAEALSAAFALAGQHRRLRPRFRALARDAIAGGSKAVAARARKLLAF